MDARSDPTYLRLYREYAKAIQGFENATKDRRRVRAQLAVRRSPVIRALNQWNRRPVGSPRGYRVPRTPPRPRPKAPPPRPRRIFLGEILGWAKIIHTSPVVPVVQPNADLDMDKLYDNASLRRYWRAKSHYLKSKRAFFDYVRRQNVDLHREQAREALGHGANLQILGLDDGEDSAFMKEAQREVEAACKNIWRIYQSSPAPRTDDSIIFLIEGIADAQFVGLESPVVQSMKHEMNRLAGAGRLQRQSQL